MEFLFQNWQIIVEAVMFLLAVVSFIVTLFVKRSVSKAVSAFKEVEDMKYRTVENRVRPKQSFSEEGIDYILNERTNELEEKPVPRNIQDYINSYLDSALERALEKFMPVVDEESDEVAYADTVSDLSAIGDAMERAELYREQYKLPDTYSMSDIYADMDKRAAELALRLKGGNDNNGQKKEAEQKSE